MREHEPAPVEAVEAARHWLDGVTKLGTLDEIWPGFSLDEFIVWPYREHDDETGEELVVFVPKAGRVEATVETDFHPTVLALYVHLNPDDWTIVGTSIRAARIEVGGSTNREGETDANDD